MAKDKCRDPNHIVIYRNEHRSPPYQADFFCQAPTPMSAQKSSRSSDPTGDSYRIARGTGTIEAGGKWVSDLSEAHNAGYPHCHVKVTAKRLDIKVEG